MQLAQDNIKTMAQSIIVGIDKSMRAQKLYMSNNEILTRLQDSLFNSFTAALNQRSTIVFGVQQYTFTMDDEVVYENKDERENFALKLYMEGMRGIRFDQGLQFDEMVKFVELLNTVVHSGDEFETTPMLWELEFEHIAYEVAEYIVDDAGYDVDEISEDILDPSMQNFQGPSSFGPPEELEQEAEDTEIQPHEKFTKLVRDTCVLDDEEFDQIQREIRLGDKHDRLMLDLFDILMTLILEEKNENELIDLYDVLLDTVDGAVVHGELHVAAQFLWAMRGLLDGGEGDFAMRHPNRILEILDKIGEPNRVSKFLGHLNLGFEGSIKDVVQFFTSLPKKAFVTILAKIHVVSSSQLRKEICLAAAELYDQNIDHFAKAFQLIKNPVHLSDILTVLSHTRDKRGVQFMEPLLKSKSRSLKISTLNLISELDPIGSKNLLLATTDDQDEGVRVNAIRAIAHTNDADIGRSLFERIESGKFEDCSLQEKRAVFSSCAKLLKDEMLPYIQSLLKKKSLFRKQQMEEKQLCAIQALGIVGTGFAAEILKHFAQNGSSFVQDKCRSEIRKIQQAVF